MARAELEAAIEAVEKAAHDLLAISVQGADDAVGAITGMVTAWSLVIAETSLSDEGVATQRVHEFGPLGLPAYATVGILDIARSTLMGAITGSAD